MRATSAGARERFDAIVFDLFGVVIAFDIRGKVSLSELHSRLVDRHGLSFGGVARLREDLCVAN